MKTIIKTDGLTKKYKGFAALDSVSLTVEQGDIYGLIGKNGAGKTTFFKLVMGLARPTSGTIEISQSADLDTARSQIGFMIGTAFFPYLNARKNIEYYRTLKGIKDRKETDRVLKLVSLDKEKKPFRAFSLGMKQRLGIAGALLGKPPIIILDEPINGLDPEGVMDIRKMIKQINRTEGTTFIVSSHILSELDLIATKFGFIGHGVLLKEISYKDLHKNTEKSLTLTVDNAEKAIKALEGKLKIKTYEKVKNNQVILTEDMSKSDKIAKTVVEAGVKLFEMRKQETSLEEYFFNLIGGGQHD